MKKPFSDREHFKNDKVCAAGTTHGFLDKNRVYCKDCAAFGAGWWKSLVNLYTNQNTTNYIARTLHARYFMANIQLKKATA